MTDVLLIQEYLNRFNNWTIVNHLDLNISKCKTITFAKIKKLIITSYCLLDIEIDKVTEFNDLGVLFTSNLGKFF